MPLIVTKSKRGELFSLQQLGFNQKCVVKDGGSL